MNDLQIYTLMAKTPNIRAVQICDALDVDLVDVSAALKSLVSVGDVMRHTGAGPNGQPTQMYNLSPDFRKSRDGAALIASLPATAPTPTPAVQPPTTPAVPAVSPVVPAPEVQAPPFVTTPVFGEQSALPRAATKVDLALEHVKNHGPVSDIDMRTVMGLPKTSAPKAYLISAIKSGRIRKNDAGQWELGDGTAPAKRAPATPAAPTVVAAAAATKEDVAGLPPEVVKQLSKPAQVLANPPTSVGPTFRCGLRSDGVLELQRDGRSLVELTRDEGEHLAEFMGRMLTAADQIATTLN